MFELWNSPLLGLGSAVSACDATSRWREAAQLLGREANLSARNSALSAFESLREVLKLH